MKKQPSMMTWLIAACLSAGLLPDLVMTICAVQLGEPLSGGLLLAAGFVSGGISLLCFMRSVYLRIGRKPDDTDKKIDIISYIAGFFPCLLLCLTVLYGSRRMLPILTAGYVAIRGLFVGITVFLVVLLLLLSGVFFFCWMNGCRKFPLEHPVRRFFARIYLGIPMTVLLWAAVFAMPMGRVFIRRVWEEPNMLIRHLALMAGALVMAGFLRGAMALTEKMMAGAGAEPAKAEAEPSEAGAVLPSQKAFSFKCYLPQLCTLLLSLFLFLSQNLAWITKNEAAILDARMKDSLIEYSFYLAAYDIGGAAGIAKEAVEQMDSALLAAEDAKEAAGKETGQDGAALRKAEKKEKTLQKVCARYAVFRTDGQALAILERFKKYGGADRAMAEEALALSEEYPDSLRVQYTAASVAGSLTYDDATHYDRTAKAILRCRELYEKEKEPTEAEKLSFGKNMAQMLFKVYHDDEAAELLEELAGADLYGDADICELLAQCYERSGRLEEAYELASQYCEKKADSPYLMYCAALSALKMEKTKESLQYTSRLASYTAGCEGEELENCDTWLFGMLEFLTLDDNSSYTGFQFDVYEKLTEEENAIIDENPFFRNYLDAVYLAYYSRHKEETEEAFGKMEAVLSENPNLASAWYLCGIISSNSKDGEDRDGAVYFYQRAGDLNASIPAVWYAMAREYDRLGEYEKGIEACKRALALLPEQDHGTDWYGINYHCSRLLKALQDAVK